METNKKLDAIFSNTLISILEELNKEGVKKEDIVNIFQNSENQYVAIFYQ